MVVKQKDLDLGYLGLFLGLRVNEMVREKGAAGGFPGMRDSYGYVVQHLIESERSITELARRMEMSQQAVSKSIAEMVKRGMVESLPADDKRARRIRLSKRGWEAVRFARSARQTIDSRLRRKVGKDDYERTKGILLACLESLGGMSRVRTRRVREPQ